MRPLRPGPGIHVLLALMLAGCGGQIGLAGSGGTGDDDTAPPSGGADDDAVGDDDSVVPGDDDAADDDAADDDGQPPDDDAADDDTHSASDDDTAPPPDDDAADDDTHSASDDDTGPPPPDDDSAPCTPRTEEFLVNGNFDSGAAWPWEETSPLPESMVFSHPPLPVTPDSGGYAAWLGGYSNADDTLAQPVAIPASATRIHLIARLSIVTDGGFGPDLLAIDVVDPGTGMVVQALGAFGESDATFGWATIEGDLPLIWAGTDFLLSFRATTNAALLTSFFLDSVSLRIDYCD
ncbi:hypothetical protein L6R50_02410 [Myxococcota bacterium]|nr:hypothetical protein [Myxococcota bacterium]